MLPLPGGNEYGYYSSDDSVALFLNALSIKENNDLRALDRVTGRLIVLETNNMGKQFTTWNLSENGRFMAYTYHGQSLNPDEPYIFTSYFYDFTKSIKEHISFQKGKTVVLRGVNSDGRFMVAGVADYIPGSFETQYGSGRLYLIDRNPYDATYQLN